MIVRVVLICLLEIDRSDYIHKGVSFAHKRKKTRKLNNAVLIDANYKQDVQVKAEDKKTAENMVDNVLLGTDLFDFKNKCDYQLKIRRKRWGDK